MGRKVFVSFLGTSNYEAIIYLPEGKSIEHYEPHRFVQESTIREFCSDFCDEDQILIFTTDSALANWNDGEHKNFRTQKMEWHEGLDTRLKNMSLSAKYKNISIPEGKDQNQIWKIFTIIFQELKDQDEITFDITHSFRSLPMLNMVLINYAKLLKNVRVSGIYYGAYEAQRESNGLKYAPIWNLEAFAKLQEWTNNASIFLKTGNASALVNQITTEPYQEFKESISHFSQYNLVNRGIDIYKGDQAVKLKDLLSKPIKDEDPATSALVPILQKIKSEFDAYESNSVINGFLAVRWCIKNGLFQQAATLLEEFITTFVMSELDELEISNKDKRTTISAALTISTNEEFKYVEVPDESKIDGRKITMETIAHLREFYQWQVDIVAKVRIYEFRKKLCELSNSIKKSIRNDMNHAGFGSEPRTYDDFEQSLIKRYNETSKILKQIKKIELPKL